MVNYYDFILGVIPLVLVGFGGGLYVFGLPGQFALAIAGLFALTLMGHALFINAPIDRHTQSGQADHTDSPASFSMSD